MTKTSRSRSGRANICWESANGTNELSPEIMTGPLSPFPFRPANDCSPGSMTTLIALRITTRRAQASTQSLETEPIAMHSRKASARLRSAASEFAVSNRANRCKVVRSASKRLTNSSWPAHSLRLPPRLSNHRILLTLNSVPVLIAFKGARDSGLLAQWPTVKCSVQDALPRFAENFPPRTQCSCLKRDRSQASTYRSVPRLSLNTGDPTTAFKTRKLHLPVNRCVLGYILSRLRL